MKHFLEKMSILSLSLMLVSTFAVTPALPQMMDFFSQQGISAGQVEGLLTITSFSIMGTLLLNDWLSRFLSERFLVSLGLVLMAVGGSMPVLLTSYPLIFLGRIALGLGIGFINARAINLIGQRYEGKEMTAMMGLRSSAEVLGSAALTALVGVLLQWGWQKAFLIYLFALLILLLFWLFVPASPQLAKEVQESRPGLDAYHVKLSLSLAFLAYLVIVVNTFLTIRIPVLVTGTGIGTARQASLILSLMQLMGIVAGVTFTPFLDKLGRQLLPLSYVLMGGVALLVSQAENLFVLTLAAMVLGFLYSMILTVVFHGISEESKPALSQRTMTIVLLGCNIGGATSSILPTGLDLLFPHLDPVGILAGLLMAVGLLLFWRSPIRLGGHS